MFGVNKNRLEESLNMISNKICAYQNSNRCDCKFFSEEYMDEGIVMGSERNSGCPEISQAKRLIQAMTAQEFERLCKRAEIRLTDKTSNKKKKKARKKKRGNKRKKKLNK